MEPQLRFVFLTGITKFSQLSVFSELNNLKNVSMRPDFAAVCGITEGELRGQMAADVEWLASELGTTTQGAYSLLKERYDGYHFSRVSPVVYNPFGLMLALDDCETGSWCYSTGTPSSLVRMPGLCQVVRPCRKGRRH